MSDEITLRYPIGKAADQPFTGKEPYAETIKHVHLREIKLLPSLLENAVLNLDEAQLHVPYRPGGWTIQQVVHHVADSHMQAYARFKLGLTEDNPTIKPYNEAAWAMLSDTQHVPVNVSLTLLHALHTRLYDLLNYMETRDWEKTIFHPQQQRTVSLWNMLAIYSWHGKHHVAHITSLRERMGW